MRTCCFLMAPLGPLLLPLLLLLPPLAWVEACREGTQSECKRAPFVPSHNLVGEGFDVVKLQRKGAYVVDMQSYRTTKGTCTLCANPLMGGQMQKLPLSVLDWRSYSSCSNKLNSASYSSVSELLQSSSSSIQNDWMVGLNLDKYNVSLQLSGSNSDEFTFASSQLRVDKSTFTSHQFSCSHYSYRVHSNPLLSFDFQRALAALPRYSSNSYRRFIDIYGTHYIHRVRLGGRFKYITSLRTCLLTLSSLSTSKVTDCLKAGLSVGLGLLKASSSFSSCSSVINNQVSLGGSNVGFLEHMTEVSGGNAWTGTVSMTRNDSTGFNRWRESVKSNPDLVDYSLLPLHELARDATVRRILQDETRKYILNHAVKKTSPPTCRRGRPNLSPNCCPISLNRGRLVVTVLRARGLKGDLTGRTEAYVKLWYGGIYRRSRMIRSNNPTWNQNFDFGYVDTTQKLKLEVWDQDWRHDDKLGNCNFNLNAGTHDGNCKVKRGPFYFKYTLTCDPQLTGPKCEIYLPKP